MISVHELIAVFLQRGTCIESIYLRKEKQRHFCQDTYFRSPPNQTLCSKSDQKLSFMTKPQLPNLEQTDANTILITNISNSNNINKFLVVIFTRQGHINQVY